MRGGEKKMKKLTVLVVIMLVAGLLAGCWLFPESKLDYIEADPYEVTLDTESLTGITQQYKLKLFMKKGIYNN